jgi:DNA-binding LytR/AlgR family response regulator
MQRKVSTKEVPGVEVEIRLDPARIKPKIIICAPSSSPQLQELARRLEALALDPIPVWEGERSFSLQQSDFLRFYTEGKGVCAQTTDKTYVVRLRLYELEELLDPMQFVRISNSEIINLDRITAVDLSLAGTIRMTLDDRATCYVSRRYVKKIKEVLSLKRRDDK